HGRPARCLRFFSLRRRPYPGTTLFPYTTLFRSLQPQSPEDRLVLSRVPRLEPALDVRDPPTLLQDEDRSPRAFAAVINNVVGLRDRKSTRLNSSHVASSYAVFCLKKKRWRRSPS